MAIFNSYVKLPEGSNYHPGMTIRKKTKETSWVHRFIWKISQSITGSQVKNKKLQGSKLYSYLQIKVIQSCKSEIGMIKKKRVGSIETDPLQSPNIHSNFNPEPECWPSSQVYSPFSVPSGKR